MAYRRRLGGSTQRAHLNPPRSIRRPDAQRAPEPTHLSTCTMRLPSLCACGARVAGDRDRLMVTWRSHPQSSSSNTTSKSVWPAYFGIIALLVLIVLALAGGIIWYNMRKSTELMVAAAEHQMEENGAKISDR